MYTNFIILYQVIEKNIIPLFTVLFVPLMIKYIEKEYLSERAKKRNVWKNFLAENKDIRKCFATYSKIEMDTDISSKTFIAITFSLTIYFISELIISFLVVYYADFWLIPTTCTFFQVKNQLILMLIVTLMFILSTPLIFYSEWMKTALKDMDLKNYEKKYSNIKTLRFMCLLLSLVQFLFITSFIVIGNEETYIYAIILAIPSLTFFNSISYKISATLKLKNIINHIYFRHFPIIEISTMGAEHHTGKLKNIFDHESIRLVNHKNETIVLWDAVASITESKETEKAQKEISYFIEYSNTN